MKFSSRVLLPCLACGFAWGMPSHAQYPDRAIRFILPYPPGGGTDATARAMSDRLSELLGQQVVIDNKPGGGANIGIELAANSAPDGYTLTMITGTHAINATLYKNLRYNLVKDFAPVSRLGRAAMVLVVHPSVPAKSVKELIAVAKKHPGELTHSSSSTGSITQLAGELFKDMTGTRMLHVPYKGGGPSVIALVSGEATVGFATMPSCIFQVKSGRLRALAVTTASRSPMLADLPTVAEAGVPGYAAEAWYGMLVPTGTPAEIIARLYEVSVKALQSPGVKKRFAASGITPIGSAPEELDKTIKEEIVKWGKIVRALKLRVN